RWSFILITRFRYAVSLAAELVREAGNRVTVGGLPVGPLGDHPEHFRSGLVGGQEPHPVDLPAVVVLHAVEVARAVEPPLHVGHRHEPRAVPRVVEGHRVAVVGEAEFPPRPAREGPHPSPQSARPTRRSQRSTASTSGSPMMAAFAESKRASARRMYSSAREGSSAICLPIWNTQSGSISRALLRRFTIS